MYPSSFDYYNINTPSSSSSSTTLSLFPSYSAYLDWCRDSLTDNNIVTFNNNNASTLLLSPSSYRHHLTPHSSSFINHHHHPHPPPYVLPTPIASAMGSGVFLPLKSRDVEINAGAAAASPHLNYVNDWEQQTLNAAAKQKAYDRFHEIVMAAAAAAASHQKQFPFTSSRLRASESNVVALTTPPSSSSSIPHHLKLAEIAILKQKLNDCVNQKDVAEFALKEARDLYESAVASAAVATAISEFSTTPTSEHYDYFPTPTPSLTRSYFEHQSPIIRHRRVIAAEEHSFQPPPPPPPSVSSESSARSVNLIIDDDDVQDVETASPPQPPLCSFPDSIDTSEDEDEATHSTGTRMCGGEEDGECLTK